MMHHERGRNLEQPTRPIPIRHDLRTTVRQYFGYPVNLGGILRLLAEHHRSFDVTCLFTSLWRRFSVLAGRWRRPTSGIPALNPRPSVDLGTPSCSGGLYTGGVERGVSTEVAK